MATPDQAAEAECDVEMYAVSALPRDHPKRRRYTIYVKRYGTNAWQLVMNDGTFLDQNGSYVMNTKRVPNFPLVQAQKIAKRTASAMRDDSGVPVWKRIEEWDARIASKGL